jgi:4-hydroxy-2-oxoheptanedioate aldolase
MPRISFLELLRSGRPLLGTWSQIASEECVDLIGAAGFDFTIVDCEHGAFGIETAERLMRAADANGIAPLVRSPGKDGSFIGRALDAGATAVVVPAIGSAEEAAAAVAATRYAPDGTRGACPCVRAAHHMAWDWRGYTASQQRDAGIVALVETPPGVADIERIVRVEGLAALMVGPFDLAVAMGRQGDYLAADVRDAIDRMLKAAAGRISVIMPLFDPSPDEAARQKAYWMDRGVNHFVVGTDKILFADAARRYAQRLK